MSEGLSLSLRGLARPGLAAALMLSAAGAAKADITVFTNFSGTPPFNLCCAYSMGAPYNLVEAMSFTAGATADLKDAVLVLFHWSVTNSPLTVDLESNASGEPGAILAILTQAGTIPDVPTPDLVTFNYSGGPVALVAGGQYWLVAVQPDMFTEDAWFLSNDDAGAIAQNTFGSPTGPWAVYTGKPIATFQVVGVPEPSSWAMMLLGFAGLGYAGYRRARAGHATLVGAR